MDRQAALCSMGKEQRLLVLALRVFLCVANLDSGQLLFEPLTLSEVPIVPFHSGTQPLCMAQNGRLSKTPRRAANEASVCPHTLPNNTTLTCVRHSYFEVDVLDAVAVGRLSRRPRSCARLLRCESVRLGRQRLLAVGDSRATRNHLVVIQVDRSVQLVEEFSKPDICLVQNKSA
jgi:hypothetical protein